MMKRLTAMLLCAVLCLAFAGAALATDPKPIYPLDYDTLPEPQEGQHHYLLLCVDQWAGKPKNLGNTDGMVMATLDTRARRIMLTSYSRDMLVQRPDGVTGRVTYIAKNYSPEALCRIMSTHFGVKVEKYLLFDFKQIANIVDFLGGVDITVTNEEANYLRRYAISPTSTTPRMYRAGTYRFGGHAAVIYMRIRKVGGGEFMRTQRVRTVMSTLADQCREITQDEAMALVDAILANTCMTNMTMDDMTAAATYAMELRGQTVEEIRMPLDAASHGITYAGMMVKEIDFDLCRAALEEYMQKSFVVLE